MWSRIGIVLTVLWMLGGTLYYVDQFVHEAELSADGGREVCEVLNESRRERGVATADCWPEWTRRRTEIADRLGTYWRDAAGGAAAIAAFVWILFFIVYFTVRWVLAGRAPKA